MYEQIRRERIYPMKTLPAQGSRNNLNAQNTSSHTVVITAVILFALSGLISGFAFGAFIRPKVAFLPTVGSENKPTIQQTSTSKPKPTSHPIPLGFPTIDTYTFIERAGGSTVYTFSSTVIDKQGRPVHASDITCKLWLVQRIPSNAILQIPLSVLKDVNTLQNPVPGTADGTSYPEVSGLNMDGSTPQTRFCNANGQTIWKYQVATTIDPGEYDLVVLADWGGVHYNWSWIHIQIRKQED